MRRPCASRITEFRRRIVLSATALGALGLALCGSATAQPLPGSSNAVVPPPGAPAPAPHLPAGGAEVVPGEGLVVEPESTRVTGKIVRIEANRITLETNDTNENVTFPVDTEAEIVLNKEPAKLGDLRPGDFIRLTLTPGENPRGSLVWAARIKDEADYPDQTYPPAVLDNRNGRGDRARGAAGGLGVVVTNTSGNGAHVIQVRPGTPAEQARLLRGDVIVGLDDTPIKTGEELLTQLWARQPRDEVLVTIWRDQQRQSARVTLTTAQRADDAVVDSTGQRVSDARTLNRGFPAAVPLTTGFPFSPNVPGGTGTTADQILQAANQVGQELRMLRQEMFRLHGVEPPPDVLEPFQLQAGGSVETSPTGIQTGTQAPPPIPPGGTFQPGTQPGTAPSFQPGTQPGTPPSFEPGTQPQTPPTGTSSTGTAN